jgi:hypothetical protein
MQWWHWGRSHQAIEDRVRVLIGDRPYAVHLRTGDGCYVDFGAQEIVVDPQEADRRGGSALLPLSWVDGSGRDFPVSNLASLEWLVANVGADHEAGHVLFTQVVPYRGSLHHDTANALEDQRMENLVAAHYPPAGIGFLAFARMQSWRCPLPKSAGLSRVNVMLNACLFYRWASRFPGSFSRRYRFHSPDDRRFWESEIRPLVEESWVAPGTAEVADLALEILRRLGVPETASSEGLVLLPGDAVRSPGGRHAGDQPLPGGRRGTPPPPPDGPRDDSHGPAPDPPAIDIAGYPRNLWPQPYLGLMWEVEGEVSRLLKALRAPSPNTRPRPATSGSHFHAGLYIRTRGKYAFLEPRGRGRSLRGLAGLVLLLDRTGSMGGDPRPIDPRTGSPSSGFHRPTDRMPHARRAAMLMEVACTRKGIPLCIGFAGTDGVSFHLPGGKDGEGEPFYDLLHPVAWLRTWETPRDAEGPKSLIAGLYGSGERECVSASLREAQRLLEQRREGTRLILYVHDGKPTDELPESVKETLAALRRKKTIIVGVYVGPKEGFKKLQDIFGVEFTILVERLSDLPKRLGRILVRYARY